MAKSDNHEYASSLKTWLSMKSPQIPRKWKRIGREVYSRKTLLMAATESLGDKRWNLTNPWKLAATDVFVEKAQGKLTFRAACFLLGGVISAALALCGAGITVYGAVGLDIGKFFGRLEVNGYTTTLVALKSSAIAAFIAGVLFYLISLSKAMFHEGTALLHRRHALRFGRLYVYLKDGNIDLKELEDAFDWNKDFTTAFREIKISTMTTPLEKMSDLGKESIKAIGSIRSRKKESDERRSARVSASDQ